MSLSASAALREGRIALRGGNHEVAAERFGVAISRNPRAALPWVLQAEAYYRLGRENETIAAAARALQLDAGAVPAWVRLGAVYLKRGDRQEAARNFERALEIDDTRADEWHRRLAGSRPIETSGIIAEPSPNARVPEHQFAILGRDLALEAKTGEGRLHERRARTETSTPKWSVGDFVRDRHEVLAVRRGGMAYVYICFDHAQGRSYALKSLKQDVLDTPGVREAFLREAELWVNIERHPHIVEADLVQVIDDAPVIFLEFIDGGSVAGLLAERPMEIGRAVDIALQVADALRQAHEQAKFIHRDVKPSNVLLTKDSTAKVTDFGLALASDQSAGQNGSAERRIFGTPQYMAPEQFSPDRPIDRRADVYAFGATLYEMLTRHWPYKATSALEFRRQHEGGPLPDPRERNKAIRPELVEIIQKCMAKNPEDRYKGFVEVAADLDRVYRLLTGKARKLMAPPDQMNAHHWIAKGVSLAQLGKHEEAVDAFDKSIRIDQELPQGWLGKAEVLRTLGRHREALKSCIRALARDPRSTQALYLRGQCNAAIDDHATAVKVFDQALAIDVGLGDIWRSKGVSHEAMGEHEAAVASYDRALGIDAAQPAIRLRKAACLMGMEDFSTAVEITEQVLETDPDNAEAWKAKGNALAALGKYGRAHTCFEKTLEIAPEDEHARQAAEEVSRMKARSEARRAETSSSSSYDRGLRRYRKGRFAEAVAELEKAAEEMPEDERVWRYLSAAHFRMGHYADAEAPARACADLEPENPAVQCNLGVVLRKLERWSDARECLKRALRLDRNYLKAREELDKVNARDPESLS